MYTYTIKRLINAPASIVWNVISGVEQYAEYAPNLSKAVKVSGDGVGMKRRCWDTRGGTWLEECVLWEDGKRYSIQVDTSDYPYPFTSMQGTWGMEEQENGILVTMQFDYQPKVDPPIIGWLMNKFMLLPAFAPIAEKLMDNWEAEMLSRVRQPQPA